MKKNFLILVFNILLFLNTIYSQNVRVISGTNPACIGSSVTIGAFLNTTTPASVRWEKMPQGTLISSSSSQINVQVTSTNQQYRALNGNFAGNVVYITIVGQTSPSGFGSNIEGPNIVCQGQGLSYTQPENANTNLWIWSYPNGFTGPSSTNNPTNNAVNCGLNAVSGNITVSRNNACGTGPSISLYVNVNPIPTNSGGISGLSNICQVQNPQTYSVPMITNADSYVWTLPNGAVGSSTSNTITVNYSNATSGNITVKGRNICGTDGPILSLPITLPVNPIITQNGNVLQSNSTTGNQWYNQNGIINGATLQNYTPSESGNYYVIITNNNCSVTSSIFNYTFLFNEEFHLRNELKVYPNPVKDRFTIDFGPLSNVVGYRLIITNTLGQEVYKTIINQQIMEINLNSVVGKGVYLLNLIDTQGNSLGIKKIILQ
jgi:hypothetical protein